MKNAVIKFDYKNLLGAVDITDKEHLVLNLFHNGMLYRQDLSPCLTKVLYTSTCFTTDGRNIQVRGSNRRKVIDLCKRELSKKQLFNLICRDDKLKYLV
jgi:hypothetical protein